MTRGGRRGTVNAMTCFSCGALLDTARSFCDDQCESFVQQHAHSHSSTPRCDRGFSESTRVRRDRRRVS